MPAGPGQALSILVAIKSESGRTERVYLTLEADPWQKEEEKSSSRRGDTKAQMESGDQVEPAGREEVESAESKGREGCNTVGQRGREWRRQRECPGNGYEIEEERKESVTALGPAIRYPVGWIGGTVDG